MKMETNINIIDSEDISLLINKMFNDKNELKLLPAKFYREITKNKLMVIGHQKAIYSFPTIEMIQWIKDSFDLSEALEIGSGANGICKFLNIKGTDSKIQESPHIKIIYTIAQQPTIKYPLHVEKIDAISAIKKYKPKIVIGSWITQLYNKEKPDLDASVYGVNEKWIIKNVDKYLFIGNRKIHKDKEILKYKHKTFEFDWHYSRSRFNNDNIIYLWERIPIKKG